MIKLGDRLGQLVKILKSIDIPQDTVPDNYSR